MRLAAGSDNLTPSLAADYARCAAVTRDSSSNFYYAFMLLAPERRRALNAIYAFCRFIDDAADDEVVRSPAQRLASWREELGRICTGAAGTAVSRALADSMRRFRISRRHLEEIIAGVEMDLTKRRYATFEELRLYCYRVAAAVGLACLAVFGCRDGAAESYAENLGIAFQLTNILRDVREDAERGRIYLPQEDLERFAVPEAEILGAVYSPRFRRLMAFEAERAGAFYRAAEAALPASERPRVLTAEAMRLIYSALLNRIVRSGFRVFDRRPRLSAAHKLYLVGRAWMSGQLDAVVHRGADGSDG